ncbi:3-oxoacyl-[acyl-carrier-protein] reductase FabG [Vibrio stylophorae]|uniref:3-oxoacyl-[acyl-carrier-protein] reductase FabG n=1 Tax=Vibrio stylophorae TaxID=659351 RepID=A0ABM8ZT17_9VIBR|nr:SDR family NAD(P)-dependent oxidoreductase [Vibrio stylophorae]CAH0533307.1 3-oxoacyl-[acyl-carrier-protein] reductase FabG [Vibrio stylophorae]
MKISGSTIAICAAGSEMGQMIAHYFAQAGATVVLIQEQAVNPCELTQGIVESDFYQLQFDPQNEQSSRKIFEQIYELIGPVDIFINYWAAAAQMNLMSDDAMTQLSGAMNHVVSRLTVLGREAAKQMQLGQGGVIINMTAPEENGVVSLDSTRAIIDGFTQTWAKELSPFNIRVGGVVPVQAKRTAGLYKPVCPQELVRSAEYIVENDYFSGRLLEAEMSMVF